MPELKEALVEYKREVAAKPAMERTPELQADVALAELFLRLDSSPAAVDPTMCVCTCCVALLACSWRATSLPLARR